MKIMCIGGILDMQMVDVEPDHGDLSILLHGTTAGTETNYYHCRSGEHNYFIHEDLIQDGSSQVTERSDTQ